MSWSAGVNPTQAGELIAAINAAEYHDPEAMSNEESDAQLVAAKKAAVAMFKSGACGTQDNATYIVNMSGHSNPQHAPRQGYSNDSINVGIQMVDARPSYSG